MTAQEHREMTIPTTTLIPRLWSLRHEMQRIMEELPDLWTGGLGGSSRLTPSEVAQLRESLLTAEHLWQFDTARRWLRRFPKAAAFPPWPRSSYGLKHVMEREAGGSCTNGNFIAAAVAEGFRVAQLDGGPNVRINISKEAWERSAGPPASLDP
jgi:hypothetical protein